VNPELIKALQDLATARRNARAASQDITAQQAADFLASRGVSLDEAGKFLAEAQKLSLRNLGRSAVQGAAMNWADELVGLFSPTQGAAMRLRDEAFRDAHPTADMIAAGAGGLATGLVTGGVAGPVTIPAAIARGGAAGLAMGGLAGAGIGTDAKSRIQGAGQGALLGAGLGAATGGVAGAVRYMGPTQRAARRMNEAVAADGGAAALLGRVDEFEAGGRGREVMFGDLGPNVRGLADFAANNDELARVGLEEAAQARQHGMSGRLERDVTGVVGSPVAGVQRDALAHDTREWADGAYGALRDENPSIRGANLAYRPGSMHSTPSLAARTPDSVDLHQILNRPVVLRQLEEAIRTGDIQRLPERGDLSFRALQEIKQNLDDAVSAAYGAHKGARGAAIAEARDELVAWMRRNVDGYQAVDTEYARRAGLVRAVDRGVELFNNPDSRPLTQHVIGLGDGELHQLRQAIASEFVSKIRQARTNRDVAKELVESGPAMMDKLRVMFADRETFEAYLQRAGLEREMARMRGTYGGSATHRRGMAMDADPLQLAEAGVVGGAAAAVPAGVSQLAKMGRGALTRREARRVGDVVRTQQAEHVRRLLEQWGVRPPMVGRVGAGGAQGALSGLLSRF
jgi:hypothetical protein